MTMPLSLTFNIDRRHALQAIDGGMSLAGYVRDTAIIQTSVVLNPLPMRPCIKVREFSVWAHVPVDTPPVKST